MNRRVMGGGGLEDDDRWPLWLMPLLSTGFFVQCKQHAGLHKSECSMYCLDCMNGSLCSLCLDRLHVQREIQLFLPHRRRQTKVVRLGRSTLGSHSQTGYGKYTTSNGWQGLSSTRHADQGLGITPNEPRFPV